MQWKGNRESTNVEDERRSRRTRNVVGGGIGTLLIAIVLYLLGGDPQSFLNQRQSTDSNTTYQTDPSDTSGQFVSVILASTEDVWSTQLAKIGLQYHKPRLLLFNEQTHSGCGGATAASGPFYCPADNKVYLDMSFFTEMKQRYGVQGRFADAYIIAHEVGHHVQNLMGIDAKIRNIQSQVSKTEGNRWSVKLELQADFLAGVWAHYAKNLQLTEQDIYSALTAANAVGDDRIMSESQGYVVPDAFTHGTSKQRMEWFMKGFKTGDLDQGNTFEDPNL